MSSIIQRFLKSHIPTRLGRWALGKDDAAIARTIDMSNHDHCGTCPTMEKKVKNDFDNSMDISICALQSFHSYPNRRNLDIGDYKHGGKHV